MKLTLNTLFISFLLYLILHGCDQKNQKNKIAYNQTDNTNVMSLEDSIRTKNGLLPFNLEWKLDSAVVGYRKNGLWFRTLDTNSGSKDIRKEYYSLNTNNQYLIKKEIEKTSIDSIKIREIDRYQKVFDDSTGHIGLFYEYNFSKNQITAIVDTMNYIKREEAEIKNKRLKKEDQQFIEDNKDWQICGTALLERKMNLFRSYYKNHLIDSSAARVFINTNFKIKELKK